MGTLMNFPKSSHLQLFNLFLCFSVILQSRVELSFERIHGAVERRLTGQTHNIECTLDFSLHSLFTMTCCFFMDEKTQQMQIKSHQSTHKKH